MSKIEYKEVVCPCCNGDPKSVSSGRPYFKTYNEIGTVYCEWCMDAGVVRERKKDDES